MAVLDWIDDNKSSVLLIKKKFICTTITVDKITSYLSVEVILYL